MKHRRRLRLLFINVFIILCISITGCNREIDNNVTEEIEEDPILLESGDEYITPNRKFFAITIGDTPKINAKDWKLEIKGEVEQPYSLTYKDITSLPSVELTSTLECIGNTPGGKNIGTAVWRGVQLKVLLEKAKPKYSARDIVFYAADGYFSSLTLSEALEENTLIVYKMNGQKLSREQGFPVRLIHPRKYGVKNPMWLTSIEVVDYDFEDYWEKRGWQVENDVKISSKIIFPKDGKRYKARPMEVWGYVWGGKGGVGRVEVSFNDGDSWFPAELLQSKKNFLWSKWSFKWKDVEPGTFNISVRATDRKGNTQPFILDSTLGGNNKIHRITIIIKETKIKKTE